MPLSGSVEKNALYNRNVNQGHSEQTSLKAKALNDLRYAKTNTEIPFTFHSKNILSYVFPLNRFNLLKFNLLYIQSLAMKQNLIISIYFLSMISEAALPLRLSQVK